MLWKKDENPEHLPERKFSQADCCEYIGYKRRLCMMFLTFRRGRRKDQEPALPALRQGGPPAPWRWAPGDNKGPRRNKDGAREKDSSWSTGQLIPFSLLDTIELGGYLSGGIITSFGRIGGELFLSMHPRVSFMITIE